MWNGLVYPIASVGDPADLKADVTATLKSDKDQRDRYVRDHVNDKGAFHSFFRYPTPRPRKRLRRHLYFPCACACYCGWERHNSRASHDFGGITLTSISSYFHSWIKSDADLAKVPPPFAPIVDYVQDFNKGVWSQEVRLASSDNSAFKWLIGGFAQGIDTYTAQLQIIQPLVAVYPDAYGHQQFSYAVSATQLTTSIPGRSREAAARILR